MTSTNREKSVVVIELQGGNDALNTVIPYNNPLYYDFRNNVGIPEGEVLHLDGEVGFNPNLTPIKPLWDQGNIAVINGIGYPNPNRSHFRSRDVWYTCESEKIGAEGWLGAAIRDLDARGENVLTGVNFGRGLPRAMVCKGVPVASVANLETYGLMPDIQDEKSRQYALEAFSRIYGPTETKDIVAQVLSETGSNALKGADRLRSAPGLYSSSVEYADTPISQSLRNMAQVMSAGLGTRIYYTMHGSFDTHSNELPAHAKLWTDVSTAIADFTSDLEEHGLADDTLILVFSEFGRRIKDNGTGTDHGSGGAAFVIGGGVNGGLYGEYPSLRPEDHSEGDLHFTNDFRSTYATILNRWLELDPVPIVHGDYEQFGFL
ncbi:MAG: DUF1501 domain-containing protein [Chloroflexota bacterium]|nr:DUF1501 domain-containing protein [Chloroflexota bacterium]MDE2683629.1 DUF1501 domain-containing protein [Chloroflexota bacterium]